MEQLNNLLTEEERNEAPQEKTQAAVVPTHANMDSPLLNKLRQKFEVTGTVSILFGGLFTLSFYKAGIGMNVLFFTAVMIILLGFVMRHFEIAIKPDTYLYYGGAALTGLSTALTANESLQFMNLILILCLLNLSILNQLHDFGRWDFLKSMGKMFGMLFLGIASIGYPFVDGLNFLKKTRLFRSEKSRNILVGLLISVPVLWIIVVLLSQADMIFGDMTKGLLEHIFSTEIIGIAFMILFGFFSCYCILCGCAAQTGYTDKPRRKGAASTAITVLLLITVIYLFFCGLQILYLFSNGLFMLPEGYTYAEYARRGFFELLAVAVINVVLMLIVTSYFEENRFLRILLTLVTVCTYVLIGSATYRMLLYIGAYHLTFLRLFVLLALLILSFVLAGVMISIYHKRFPLFRYSVAVITVFYLLFSFAKPDYFIASYLEEQNHILRAEDADYLTQELSLDAAPVVLPLLSDSSRWTEAAKQGTEGIIISNEYEIGFRGDIQALDNYITGYYDKIDRENIHRAVRDYNLSVSTAIRLSDKYPIPFYKK